MVFVTIDQKPKILHKTLSFRVSIPVTENNLQKLPHIQALVEPPLINHCVLVDTVFTFHQGQDIFLKIRMREQCLHRMRFGSDSQSTQLVNLL